MGASFRAGPAEVARGLPGHSTERERRLPSWEVARDHVSAKYCHLVRLEQTADDEAQGMNTSRSHCASSSGASGVPPEGGLDLMAQEMKRHCFLKKGSKSQGYSS